MFSNDPLLPASANPSTRNPRRRQRPQSEENGAPLPKAKKRRGALASDTFVKPDDSEGQKDVDRPMNGTAITERRSASASFNDLPVRETRKTSLRGFKGDGSVVLTKNDKFTVSKLVALPDALRTNQDVLRAAFSDTSYALAITPTQALAWPYEASISSPETFVFELPSKAKAKANVLPLGALVPASISSAEPGLVVVMPTTGKVTYWESITSAAALDLTRRQRSGLEASVGSMSSGESIVHLIDASPVGFMLGFSSGRIALLSLRDAQGRPTVRVQALQSHFGGAGGLFSGLRNVFVGGGGWGNDMVAVKAAARRRRDERDVAVLTAKGMFQIWTVHRGGQHSLQQEARIGENMRKAIKTADPDLGGTISDENFEVLDFAFLPGPDGSDDAKAEGDGDGRTMLVLAVVHDESSASYCLVEVLSTSSSLTVGLVYPVRSYAAPFSRSERPRPKLLVPCPPHSAFVLFDKAVVVASLDKSVNTPEEQLLQDLQRFPKAFEDVIDFRGGTDVEIVGAGAEDASDVMIASKQDTATRRRSRHAACIVLLKGFGVVRVTVPPSIVESTTAEGTGLTIKSKIEQAIRYGAQPHNPIEFSFKSDVPPSQEDAERAALTISDEILDSTSSAVPYLTPSLEHQLSQRALALKELASFVKANLPPLSRVAKWKLLWGAEKLAAARAVWKKYDSSLKKKTKKLDAALLAELVDQMNNECRTEPNPDKGEVDKVRHWFTKDIGKMERLVPWAYNVFTSLYVEGSWGPGQIAVLVAQADDVFIAVLTTAFAFRQEHAPLYGLDDEPLEEGLLHLDALKGLPEFWTSDFSVQHCVTLLADYTNLFVRRMQKESTPYPDVDLDVVAKIAQDNPMLVGLSCQTFIERLQWLFSTGSETNVHIALKMRKEYETTRRLQLLRLAPIGLVDPAIELAEKYHDMDVLVQLVGTEMSEAAANLGRPGIGREERAKARERLDGLHDRFESYFSRFGVRWATALFSRQVLEGKVGSMLDDNAEWQSFLTGFLRGKPQFAKASWINEVLGERDFGQATQDLLDIAVPKERELWAKKVELSMGKLTLLAGTATATTTAMSTAETTATATATTAAASGRDGRLARADQDLEMVAVQDKLYRHIASSIREAIDEAAEIDLVRKDFGSQVTKDKPALSTILEQGLTALVAQEPMSATMLIDVLTLMDHHYDLDNASELTGQEFYQALRIAKFVRSENVPKGILLERIIWRRCMIRDDWTVINDTKLKADRAVEQSTGNTALFLNLRAGHQAGLFTPPSPFRPRGPNDVAGAGLAAADLKLLYPEDLCNPIAADMRKEDERLQVQMERGRLEQWFSGVSAAVHRSRRSEADVELGLARTRRTIERNLGAYEDEPLGPPLPLDDMTRARLGMDK